MTRLRNPYDNRRAPSARTLRRAATLSPRQQARAVDRLKATADRMIREGLEETLAQRFADPSPVAAE